MAWRLTLKVKSPSFNTKHLTQSVEDWSKARKDTPRKTGESDLAYHCRAWSNYLGTNVVDYEWED